MRLKPSSIPIAFIASLLTNAMVNTLNTLISYRHAPPGLGLGFGTAIRENINPFQAWDWNKGLVCTPVILFLVTFWVVTSTERRGLLLPLGVGILSVFLLGMISIATWPRTSMSLELAGIFVLRVVLLFVASVALAFQMLRVIHEYREVVR